MLKKMMVVLSGGQDSTTCLRWAMQQAESVRAIFVDYGQRHIRELASATAQAGLAQVQLDVVAVPDVLVGTSPLVSKEPLEQYQDWESLPGGLEKTFVPMRNQLFLTIAANRAVAWGCDNLVTGVCQEDFGGYPDCRQTFITAVEAAIRHGTFLDAQTPFRIHTPLMNLTKSKSVELALELPGCYAALGFSHTSYDGAYPPTGHDHATLLRAKGFDQALVPDPLVVRAFWEGVMELPRTENYLRYEQPIRHLRRDLPVGMKHNLLDPEYLMVMAGRLEELRKVL